MSISSSRLSTRSTTAYAAVTAVSFSASSSAPTPLYHIYQQDMHLSALMITLVFASYAATMVVSFLTVARLSDYVGRRPMVLVALLANAVSLLLFIFAASASGLIAARMVQGVATGIGMATLGAMILDTDARNGSIYNSVTAFIGLMLGSLLGGALVAWAPLPTQLVFVVLLAVTLLAIAVLGFAPETVSRKAGAFRVLVPHVAVPAAALPVLVSLLPLTIAAWALGGFYLSLMPSLVTVATGVASPFIGAAVVSVLMAVAAVVVFALRPLPARRLLPIASVALALGVAVTLVGIYVQRAEWMLVGTAIAGIGFGAGYSGSLKALLPLAEAHQRAGLLAAYFVQSYTAFAVPAIVAGLAVPSLGLVLTGEIYGVVVIVLTVVSALLSVRPRVRVVA